MPSNIYSTKNVGKSTCRSRRLYSLHGAGRL